MRAFLAITLSDEVIKTLVICQEALRDADGTWRGDKWTAAQNLHSTLHFFGDVPAGVMPDVLASIRQALVDAHTFELTWGRLEAVPRIRSMSLLWAVPHDGRDALVKLNTLIEQGIQTSPLAPKDATVARSANPRQHGTQRPFRAHVTLCRARRPHPVEPDALTRAETVLLSARPQMSVHEITLFSSTLTRQGPIYEAVDRIPLTM